MYTIAKEIKQKKDLKTKKKHKTEKYTMNGKRMERIVFERPKTPSLVTCK